MATTRPARALLAAAAAIACAQTAAAADRQWSTNCNNAVVYNWYDANCWQGGIGPQPLDNAAVTAGPLPPGITVLFQGSGPTPDATVLNISQLAVNGGLPLQPIRLIQSTGTINTTVTTVGSSAGGILVVGGVQSNLPGAPGFPGGTFNANVIHLGSLANGNGSLFIDAPLSRVGVGTLNVGQAGRGAVTLSNGRLTAGTITINAASTFSQDGGLLAFGSYRIDGIVNDGTLRYAAGTLQDVGLTNRGTLQLDGSMSITGLANAGSVSTLPTGRQLSIGTGGGSNKGSMALSGGSLAIAVTFDNLAAGLVEGRGTLAGAGTFVNNAGSKVAVTGGNLAVTLGGGFFNKGTLALETGAQRLVVLPSAPHGIANTGSIALGGGAITGGGFLDNNQDGCIGGGGKIDLGSFANNGGRIQVDPGAALTITTAANGFVNTGSITLTGTSTDAGQNGRLSGSRIGNGANGRIEGTGAIDNDIVNGNGATVQVAAGRDLVVLGAFTAEAGSTVRVDTGSRLFLKGATVLRNGATVTGGGQTSFGGTLDVGNSPGVASIAGNAVLASGSRYTAEIGGAQPASFDRLRVGGTLDLLGGTLVLSSYAGFIAQQGQVFDLFDFAQERGSFGVIDARGLLLAPGATLDFTRLYVDGSIAVVPEPSRWLLLATGVLPLLARRRRAQG